MRRCLAVLVVLCLLPIGLADGDGLSHTEFNDRVLEGALGPMDLHGTRLAWTAQRDGYVELMVTDLRDGAEFAATRVPVEGKLSIQSLAFDGRWIAWTDDRFRNLDAFAIDTESGRLLRLSEHSQDDLDIDVNDGWFAWVRRGTGLVLADHTGTAREVPGSGVAFEPAFAGSWLVWSQIEGNRRIIRGQYLADGSMHSLADDEGVVHKNVDGASDGHIIWTGVVGEQTRVLARLLGADGTLGETRFLTDWGLYLQPRTGGGHGAWMGDQVVHVERISDGQYGTNPVFRPPLLSSELFVTTVRDGSGIRVTPTAWEEWGTRLPVEPRDPRPFIVAAGLAVLLGGSGIGWWRSRRKAG